MEPGNKVELPHGRDRRKKSPGTVCSHQLVAKNACGFRWRSNSARSAYKIARCIADFSKSYILWPITADVNNAINQSELVANRCNRRQARDDTCEQITDPSVNQ